MNGALGHDAVPYGAGTTWAFEMNFVMNHAPGAESIARLDDQQSSALPLCGGCPLRECGMLQGMQNTSRFNLLHLLFESFVSSDENSE